MDEPLKGQSQTEQAVAKKKKLRFLRDDQFLSSPIYIGMPLFIEIRYSSGKTIKTQTKLIGYDPGKLIIIQTPLINVEPTTFGVNSTVVVRYMLEGDVYGFTTTAISTFTSPSYMTFLVYPEIVEQVSLRGGPRVQVVIPFTREGGNLETESILNLSGGGALLQMSDAISPNDQFTINFVLPNGAKVTEILSTVKRANMSSFGFFAGVLFDKQNADFKHIDHYVTRVLDTLVAFGRSQSASPSLDGLR